MQGKVEVSTKAPVSTKAAGKAKGQVVDIKFYVQSAGRKEYTLFVMSDCWVAVDIAQPVRVKVQELSRAEKEGRASRSRVVPLDEEGNPEGGNCSLFSPH